MGLRSFEDEDQDEKQKVTAMERTSIDVNTDGLSKSRMYGIQDGRMTLNKWMTNNIEDLMTTSGGSAYSRSGLDAGRGCPEKKMGHWLLADQVSAESTRMDLSENGRIQTKMARFCESEALQWAPQQRGRSESSVDSRNSPPYSSGKMMNYDERRYTRDKMASMEAEDGVDSPGRYQVIAAWNGISPENSPPALARIVDHRKQQQQSSLLHRRDTGSSAYSNRGGTTDPEEIPILPSSPELDDRSPTSHVLQQEADSVYLLPDIRTNKMILLGNTRIVGLSPRHRLLYRYQLEELMKSNNEHRQQQQQQQQQLQELHDSNVPNDDDSRPVTTPADARLDDDASFPAEHDDVDGRSNSSSSSTNKPIENNDNLQLQQMMSSSSSSSHDYVCHICNYVACTKEDYDCHMEGSHFTHKCLVCPYSSRSAGRLNRHVIDFHSSDAPANKKSKRQRKYNCKQCAFATCQQEEMWEHTRVHVPASKLLSCPRCPFVCAFKHHMQYHMNNHFGYKPFKCEKCNYECNNKSMLNSHQKSHSNDYPFRCGSCYYAAKYRHALNLHLQKKNHVPASDLGGGDGGLLTTAQEENYQGTSRVSRSRGHSSSAEMSASLSIRNRAFLRKLINRRPPLEEEEEERKREEEEEEEFMEISPWLDSQPMETELTDSINENFADEEGKGKKKKRNSTFTSNHSFANSNLLQPPLLPISEMHYRFFNPRLPPAALAAIPTHPMPVLVRNPADSPPEMNVLSTRHVKSIPVNQTLASDIVRELLFSEIGGSYTAHLQQGTTTTASNPPHPGVIIRNDNYYCSDSITVSGSYDVLDGIDGGTRRPSFSDEASYDDDSSVGESVDDAWPLDLTAKVDGTKTGGSSDTGAIECSNDGGSCGGASPELDWYECQHCGIIFPDRVLYSMHMDYHNKSDPFQCNLCGQKTKDRRDFFNHISMVAHA